LKINSKNINCPNVFKYIIVIQVHNRKEFLEILFESLKKTEEIEKSLTVISIDVYDDVINRMINSIDFGCFVQIYHPFSMSFYLNQYPAEDPRDCTRDQKTNLESCNQQAKADMYGHYREAKFSQIKLHWTWKINFVVRRIGAICEYEYIILLEEDHFLSSDALVIANQNIIPALIKCESEDKICLGTLGIYPRTFTALSKVDTLITTLWNSGKHNMGMIISKKWFKELESNAETFCNHDDYNWDFSLMKISQNKNWKVIYPQFARVYHLGGECGYHTRTHTCNHQAVLNNLNSNLEIRKSLLFPNSKLKTATVAAKFPTKFKGYGGWGDERDRRLCLSYFKSHE
jgi:alpha-1,6-mannosyl-glycoprotein beta-1,2-N-acetylglucosaminyltransferase